MTKKTSASAGERTPTRREVLDYLNANDGAASRRDLARALGLKNDGRAALRALLKTMEDESAIVTHGLKRIELPMRTPSVAPIDIIDVDDDGDLLAFLAGDHEDNPPLSIVISARDAAKQRPPLGVGDRILARLHKHEEGVYRASVIKKIGKDAKRFLAVYRKHGDSARAEPIDRKAKGSFHVNRGDANGACDGDLVWVEAKNERGYGPRKVRVSSIEGHVDEPGAYSAIALANHSIPIDFPAEAVREAQRAKSPPLGDRTDLRDTPLFTIDPADARDHDDACFAEPDDDPANAGGHRIIVAIADVSHFAPHGSAIDREAHRRGNSVYLPDRVVPMLPEELSTDLCSLRPNVERACIAVELKISADGSLKNYRFMRAMMRSIAKLAYEEAQAIEDGADAPSELRSAVSALFCAFRTRMKERTRRAPLNLDTPERKPVLDENGRVVDIYVRERFDAHRVIEEFMILANVAAAMALERARLEAIFRVHDQPDENDIAGARDYLGDLGYSLAKGTVRPANFNQILKIARERDEAEMVTEIVLRAQRQAIYDTENRGHFGLNLPRYTHFTSPIRRYADLTVHRGLIRAFKLGPDGQENHSLETLADTAEKLSNLERRAIAAEREASDRYMSDYLSERIGDSFRARIRGVTRFGLFVMLEDSGADGFVPMRSLVGERWRFEEDNHRLVGERSGDIYRLGQPVTVRLEEAQPITGSLRFSMETEPLQWRADKKVSAKAKAKPARKRRSENSKPTKGPIAKTKKRAKTQKKKVRRRSNAKPKRPEN